MSNEIIEVDDGTGRDDVRVLTAEESALFVDLERRIERGLNASADAGEALEHVRVTGLYRATHATWPAYLSERWSLSRGSADHYIQTWRVRRHLASASPESPPPSLGVAVELHTLAIREPESVASLYAEAVAAAGGTVPTAKAVREAVDRKLGKPGRRTDGEIVKAWASGEQGDRPYMITLTLTTEEGILLGKSAERNGVRVHEEGRRCINKCLAFEAG